MTFREYLNEMPYLEIDNQITDLELEKIKTQDQFISYLKFFFSLSNKTLKDKYGTKIDFKNGREREKIKNLFFNNIDVQNFLPSVNMKKSELKTIMKNL